MSDELNEVWELYAEEGSRSLDEAEAVLPGLRNGTADESAVAALFRALHTFKGNARVMGLAVVESRAHLAEDLIGLVRDEGAPLDAELIDGLLEAVDVLRGMLEDSVATRRDARPEASEALAERLRRRVADWRAAASDLAAAVSEAAEGGISKDVHAPFTGDEIGEPLSRSDAPAEARDEPVHAIVFEPPERNTLADDPVYREIFGGMAHDVLREMRQAAEALADEPAAAWTRLAAEAERLRHAAAQIGLTAWETALAALLEAGPPGMEQAAAAIERLEAMAAEDFGEPVRAEPPGPAGDVPGDPVRRFFDDLAKPLGSLAGIGSRLSTGRAVAREEVAPLIDEIRSLAEPHGFQRLAAVAEGFLGDIGTGDASAHRFRRLEFLLYEELAAIGDALLADRAGLRVDAAAVLRNWCAERVFDSLLDMGDALERLRKREDVAGQCERINEVMRQVYYACQYYGLETAAHLSMSLVDLFARILTGEMAPDALVLHIAKSFVADMEVVLDAASSGDVPDMEIIEKLLQDASDAAFAVSGTVSSSQIEIRLGLPKSFHKVLTPESVKLASEALKAGRRFFIVRADLNADEDLAAGFLAWLDSGAAQVISNVTVFEGNRTLFDFLLATPLAHEQLSEALLRLDPRGAALRVEVALADRKSAEREPGAAEGDGAPLGSLPAQETMSGDMLESIGELVTAQAVVHHLLASLAEDDWVRAVESELNGAGGSWSAARGAVRSRLEGWRDKVDKLVQVESQIDALLDRLQESSIAVRMRPANLVLRPLGPFAEALAQQHGRRVAVTTDGDDVALDVSLLENLKAPLRALVAFCALQSVEAPERRAAAGKNGSGRVRVVLVKEEDHVRIAVEDDGSGIDPERVAQRRRQLGWDEEANPVAAVLRDGFGVAGNGESAAGSADLAGIRAALRVHGGDLRVANLPSGGVRFSLTLPLAMVVLEGMVVRAGEVRYVVPIDAIQRIVHSGGDEMLRISADSGRHMLRLAGGDVLPVQFLRRGGREACPAVEGGPAAASRGEEGGDAPGRKHLFVVVGKQLQRAALAVDELIGQQQVLIRPLQGYLSGIRGVTGCALLGSGDVGMVLDMGYVLGHEMGFGI
jgi:two-component system chemotaxis sensor kinase CheA